MPKALSEKERKQIIKDLKKSALDCMILYGIRKTTVDELIKRANIPKGTFYLFYSSKELLLYDTINSLHDDIQNKLVKELQLLSTDLSVDSLTDIIYRFYKITDKSKIVDIFKHNDLDLLLRKIPDEEIAKHFERDKIALNKMLEYIPNAKEKDISKYESAIRAIFCSMLHKREIGEKFFDESMKILIRGIVIQLME